MNIQPIEDRKLLEQYEDYKTGYWIVEEIDWPVTPTHKSSYCRVFDQTTGEEIPPTSSLRPFGGEDVQVTHVGEFEIRTNYTVNRETGQESSHEALYDRLSGAWLTTSNRNAFSPTKVPSIIEKYLARQAERRKQDLFWVEEYPKMSVEERKGYWIRNTLLAMRMQGEAGGDELDVFSKSIYDHWKQHDPDFDEVFDALVQALSAFFGDEDIGQRIKEAILE